MCDVTATEDTPDPEPDLPKPVHVAPPGHSRAGHRTFGWCSACPDRELWEELVAWRARSNREIDESPIPDRAVAPSKEAARG
ncbi:hypothetical protein [Streptomyces sp. AMCC400023]|uniref:hypothetical protein n=1 Tax=Streptomyces sp. AMCC400023 TaxID=2056258 RepID=UPI001F3FAAFC|nr:hypothetical protein [Streptomyces sp. AMCC400023]UJV42974.1 hypothetical protein CVT30_26820 [Streptomyces sp. AMCC400023]